MATVLPLPESTRRMGTASPCAGSPLKSLTFCRVTRPALRATGLVTSSVVFGGTPKAPAGGDTAAVLTLPTNEMSNALVSPAATATFPAPRRDVPGTTAVIAGDLPGRAAITYRPSPP